MSKYWISICVALLLTGCGKPTIDSTSDEAMKTSIARVRAALPEDKRDEFDKSVQTIAFSKVDIGAVMTGGKAAADVTVAQMKSTLNGKTAEQVIAEASKITEERKKREREQALVEIKELEAKKASAETAKGELAKFQVLRSRYYKKKEEYSFQEQPIIELSVHNGTGHPISRAYFVGTLASPGRSVPWLRDSFNYSISGGLEDGEDAHWSLAPNKFSDWGNVNPPADAILTVIVEKLDGSDGKTLFSSSDFTERDAERLQKLTTEYVQGAVSSR